MNNRFQIITTVDSRNAWSEDIPVEEALSWLAESIQEATKRCQDQGIPERLNTYPVLDPNGNTIGEVSVRISPL